MVNLNMGDTLARAVTSVASQLDHRFEIIIVDGGSSDNSVDEILKLQQKFPFIILHELPPDKNRRIGQDRNISVELAQGQYVLLNIDCDDFYDSHILDWISCFHFIETINPEPMLVSGKQINMLSKKLFWELGGYNNIRFEDRDLWMRSASVGKWVSWKHKSFVTRMPRNKKQVFYKNFIENAHGVISDYQHGLRFWQMMSIRTHEFFKSPSFNAVIKLVYAPIFLPISFFYKNLREKHHFDPVSFSRFHKENTKSLCEITGLEKNAISIEFLNAHSRKIFLEE